MGCLLCTLPNKQAMTNLKIIGKGSTFKIDEKYRYVSSQRPAKCYMSDGLLVLRKCVPWAPLPSGTSRLPRRVLSTPPVLTALCAHLLVM